MNNKTNKKQNSNSLDRIWEPLDEIVLNLPGSRNWSEATFSCESESSVLPQSSRSIDYFTSSSVYEEELEEKFHILYDISKNDSKQIRETFYLTESSSEESLEAIKGDISNQKNQNYNLNFKPLKFDTELKIEAEKENNYLKASSNQGLKDGFSRSYSQTSFISTEYSLKNLQDKSEDRDNQIKESVSKAIKASETDFFKKILRLAQNEKKMKTQVDDVIYKFEGLLTDVVDGAVKELLYEMVEKVSNQSDIGERFLSVENRNICPLNELDYSICLNSSHDSEAETFISCATHFYESELPQNELSTNLQDNKINLTTSISNFSAQVESQFSIISDESENIEKKNHFPDQLKLPNRNKTKKEEIPLEIPVKVESGSKHLTEDETFQKFDPIKACSWNEAERNKAILYALDVCSNTITDLIDVNYSDDETGSFCSAMTSVRQKDQIKRKEINVLDANIKPVKCKTVSFEDAENEDSFVTSVESESTEKSEKTENENKEYWNNALYVLKDEDNNKKNNELKEGLETFTTLLEYFQMFFKLEENNTANSKEKVLLQKEESSLDCTEMSNEVNSEAGDCSLVFKQLQSDCERVKNIPSFISFMQLQKFKQSAENIKSKSIEPKSECESSSASSVFAVQQNLQTKPLKVPQKKQNSERKVSSSKTMKKANQISKKVKMAVKYDEYYSKGSGVKMCQKFDENSPKKLNILFEDTENKKKFCQPIKSLKNKTVNERKIVPRTQKTGMETNVGSQKPFVIRRNKLTFKPPVIIKPKNHDKKKLLSDISIPSPKNAKITPRRNRFYKKTYRSVRGGVKDEEKKQLVKSNLTKKSKRFSCQKVQSFDAGSSLRSLLSSDLVNSDVHHLIGSSYHKKERSFYSLRQKEVNCSGGEPSKKENLNDEIYKPSSIIKQITKSFSKMFHG